MALAVVGHHIFCTRWFGNSFFSSMNFPLESIKSTISGLEGVEWESCCDGAGADEAGWAWSSEGCVDWAEQGGGVFWTGEGGGEVR